MDNKKLQSIANSLNSMIPDELKKPQNIWGALINIIRKYKVKFDFYSQNDLLNIFFNILSLRETGNFEQASLIRKNVKFFSTCKTEGENYTENCDNCEEGWAECSNCNGDGWEKCEDCDGDGDLSCDSCDGDGTIEDSEGNTLECDKCNGEGQISCYNCDGSGRVDCDECLGNGRDSCRECDGDGTIEHEDRVIYTTELYCSWNKDVNNTAEIFLNEPRDFGENFALKNVISLGAGGGDGELEPEFKTDEDIVYYFDDVLPSNRKATMPFEVPDPKQIFII